MRTILIINDNSAEAKHAAEFVLAMAQKMEANIMLMNTFVFAGKVIAKVPAGYNSRTEMESLPVSPMFYYLNGLSDRQPGYKPGIEECDVSNKNETEIIELINRNHIWMMVKGMADVKPGTAKKQGLNIHSILNRVLCPLMLIPEQWQLKAIERLSYIADLRYCRIHIVRYLAELAALACSVINCPHVGKWFTRHGRKICAGSF